MALSALSVWLGGLEKRARDMYHHDDSETSIKPVSASSDLWLYSCLHIEVKHARYDRCLFYTIIPDRDSS